MGLFHDKSKAYALTRQELDFLNNGILIHEIQHTESKQTPYHLTLISKYLVCPEPLH